MLSMAGERGSFGLRAAVNWELRVSTLKIVVLGCTLFTTEQLALLLWREELGTFSAKPVTVLPRATVPLLSQKVGRIDFSVFLRIAKIWLEIQIAHQVWKRSHKIQRPLYARDFFKNRTVIAPLVHCTFWGSYCCWFIPLVGNCMWKFAANPLRFVWIPFWLVSSGFVFNKNNLNWIFDLLNDHKNFKNHIHNKQLAGNAHELQLFI